MHHILCTILFLQPECRPPTRFLEGHFRVSRKDVAAPKMMLLQDKADFIMNSYPIIALKKFISSKRIFDIILSSALLTAFLFPMLFIALIITLTSPGPALYWSDRVGKGNTLYRMPKFRSMRLGTPNVATHLMVNPSRHVTPIGVILRRFSIDELPQLYSVFKGDMSIVGPRPALFNQDDLISLRTQKQIHQMIPGITGWAQVNGRDELPIPAKVLLDEEYLRSRSFDFDLRIVALTMVRAVRADGVAH